MTWVKVRDGQRINHGPGVQLEGGSVIELDDREASALAEQALVDVVPAPKARAKAASRLT